MLHILILILAVFMPTLTISTSPIRNDTFRPLQQNFGILNPLILQILEENPVEITNESIVVDVMVTWTRNSECELATGQPNFQCSLNDDTYDAMLAWVKKAVKLVSIAMKSSNVPVVMRLVRGARLEQDVEQWYFTREEQYEALKSGKLEEISPLREANGADLVSLLSTSAYGGFGTYIFEPAPADAFSALNWEWAVNGFGLAHELGHNFGLQHDRGTKNRCNMTSMTNFGYRDPDSEFRTLMAYDCLDGPQCDNRPVRSCPVILQYSNPYNTYDGKPVGTEKENNAARIMETAKAVASYLEPPDNTKS